jgi:hypothetical protein
MSDREQLNQVLGNFGSLGYKISGGQDDCNSCVAAALDLNETDQYIFWTTQDEERAFPELYQHEFPSTEEEVFGDNFKRGGRLQISWRGEGEAITEAFRQAGFMVDWKGQLEDYIFVSK